MSDLGLATKPLVSIVVTSYNHAEYLDQRMESLLAQTYGNIEIHVVDDGSTDGSAEVLAKYRECSNVHVTLMKDNGGYARASNLGVSFCSGDYIMFAECDDYSSPEQVQVLMDALLENESVGVVYSRSNIVDEKGRILGDDFKGREEEFKARCFRDAFIPQKEMQKFLLSSCVIPNMSAVLMKKKYFNLVSGLSSSYRACADWDFWCRIAEHCDFYYLVLPLNNFRTHQATVRSSFSIKTQVCEMFDVLYKAYLRAGLSSAETRKFKVNVGFIWANYIVLNAFEWIVSFFFIWKHSIRYEKWSLVYLLAGFIKRVMMLAKKILCLNVIKSTAL